MRKLLIILSLLPLLVFGQSETHNLITYDTSIAYVGSGAGSQIWQVQITRPTNYFTAGNPDTASRLMILTMQGALEVGTTFVNHYGPHYWLANGWDGGITIGNGTHYPIYITIMPAAINVRPNFTGNLIHALINEFHPRGKIAMAGLSMGVQCLGWALIDSTTTSQNTLMNLVGAFVDQEGENPSTYGSGFTSTFPNDFGAYARSGGKFLGIEGDADTRNVWQIRDSMNLSVSNSAFFVYQNFGGGGHGSTDIGNDGTSIDCWNYFYDRRTTDLTNTNSYITYSYNSSTHPHSLGTYTGPSESMMQWMIRQLDTTLVTSYSYYYPQDAAGEYVRSEIHNGILYTITQNSNLSGTNSWISGVADSVTTAGVRFIGVWPGLHTTYAIDNTANANLYAFGSNNMGQCGQGNTTSTIQTPAIVVQDSSGHPFTGIAGVAPYYCANDAEGAFIWKKGNDTLWIMGRTQYGIRGDGTYGSVATVYPTPVFVSADGTPIRKVIAGQHVIVLTFGGHISGWGGVNSTGYGINLADVGTNASGTSYLTAAQFAGSGYKDIAGGLSFNFAYDSSNHLYGWGYWGEYMGSTNGNWHPNVPTRIDSLIYPYLDTAAISMIGTNLACTQIITAKGTLRAFGDNAVGCIGNGQELNWASTTPGGSSQSYQWDFGRAELIVNHPVQITDKHDWVSITYNSQFGLSEVARDVSGKAYNWGRGKGSVLANQTKACSATIEADLANSFDITSPKWAANTGTITSVTTAYTSPCPGCLNGTLVQADSPCSTCSYPAVTAPTANAGSNQTISGSSATISASASTDPVAVVNYRWKDLSGLKSYITLPQNVTTTVDSMAAGVHTMQLTVINPGLDSSTSTMTITVGSSTPPTVSAGPNLTVFLGNVLTLSGTATGNGGATITSTTWSCTSRPAGAAAPTIASPSSLMTNVTGLVPGVYTFQLSATDSNSNSNSATTTVAVIYSPLKSPIRVLFK